MKTYLATFLIEDTRRYNQRIHIKDENIYDYIKDLYPMHNVTIEHVELEYEINIEKTIETIATLVALVRIKYGNEDIDILNYINNSENFLKQIKLN